MAEITVRKGTEVRTVTPDNNDSTYVNNCFSAKVLDGRKENYHIRGICAITPDIVSESELWDIVPEDGEIPGWPPQENDVWKSPNYVMHFISGIFHFKNMYSGSVYSECDARDAKTATDNNLILLYRHDGNTV